MKKLTALAAAVVFFAVAGFAAAADDSKKASFYEGKININTATARELSNLPAIDIFEAKRIVDYRTTTGNFTAIDDLLKVKGIRRMEYNRIENFLTLEGDTTLALKDPSLFKGKININTATVEEFAKLPAIDRLEAQRIVDYRTQKGKFTDIDDLLKVKGVRRLEYRRIKKFLTLEGETTLTRKTVLPFLEGKININTATVEEFAKLPTIGKDEGQKIIDYRTAKGPFRAVDDLLKVEGIRRIEYEPIEKFLILEGETTLRR
ncbi:ComEA family DNA-binding protein [Thermodesulfobacteriota bacterium]